MNAPMNGKNGTRNGAHAPSLLIHGGRLIDPAQRMDAEMDLLLRNGVVAEIAPTGGIKGSAETKLDARGLIVAPGFIDLHVHFREPGQAHKETIASGSAAAAAGGFTSVCVMPNTNPVNDNPEVTEWMQQPERGSIVNLFVIAAATRKSEGRELTDFRELQRAGAIAVTDDGRPILEDSVMRQVLQRAAECDLVVIQHAEDTRVTANCPMNAGPTAFRLGLRGWPASAETSIVERDIYLSQATRGRLHVAHLSAGGALEAVRRAKRQRVPVTCEVTPHHFTLLDENVGEYDSNYKMNPPLRSAEDRAALIAGLADGTVDAIATDHAPHAAHEKAMEFERAPFGITGLETALPLAITQLHRAGPKLSLSRIIELFTSGPSRVVGWQTRGTLAKGAFGDVTLFDPKKRWTNEAAKSLSKSKNSPFDGWQFTGKVVATVVRGKIVYGG